MDDSGVVFSLSVCSLWLGTVPYLGVREYIITIIIIINYYYYYKS